MLLTSIAFMASCITPHRGRPMPPGHEKKVKRAKSARPFAPGQKKKAKKGKNKHNKHSQVFVFPTRTNS
ncbi:hypothetical protein ACYX7F_14525 [Sphingobacterium hungaricum]